MQTTVPNAQIYYTMDGTVPDGGSLLYTGPITLNQTTTLRAVAYVFGQPVATVLSQYTRTSGSAAVQVNTNLDHVIVYPNPWRSDLYTVHKITFGNLPSGSTVKLFTLAGHEVKELSSSGNVAAWDLTTDSGSPAASGVYFYLVQDMSGEKARGKLALIR